MSTNSSDGSKLDQWTAALGGNSGTEEPLSSATEDDESIVRAEESTVDGSESGETEDTQVDSQESLDAAKASSKSEAKPGTSDKEVIAVTDESGRKRKIEIDFSNRDSIKKAFAAAAGMRKFQAERDSVIQARKGLETELTELKGNWSALDGAYQNGGIAGLVDLLEGRKGAYSDHVKREIEKAKFLERASPDEIDAYNLKEAHVRNQKELEKLRKDNEEFKAKVTQEREQAELKETQSKVFPVFEKYRFADKLGDEQDEHMFDQMLWNTALERLKPYEEKGILTQAVMDQEFRNVAATLRKRINVQADKQVSKVVEQKKQEATENAQAKVKSSYNKSTDEDKLKAHLKSGNTDAIFKNWSTFKGILGSRK